MSKRTRMENRCKRINELAEKANRDGNRRRYLELRKQLFNEQARLRGMECEG